MEIFATIIVILICFMWLPLILKIYEWIKQRANKMNDNIQVEKNQKNIWILIFCVISFISSVFYTPYDYILQNGKFAGKMKISSIFSPPKANRIRIDYETIAIRELIILVGCGAGYTVTTMIKRN